MIGSTSFPTLVLIFQSLLIGIVVRVDAGILNEEDWGFANISQVPLTENPSPLISFSSDNETIVAQSRSGCSCGIQNFQQTRVVGGVEAQPNEFPWRCYLQRGGSFFCGCTLISNRWVMTAAHCTMGYPAVNVVLGAHNRLAGAKMTTVASKRIINHPRVNSQRRENDIALIELSRPITPSRDISPVCLPWGMESDMFVGKLGVGAGWGRTSATGPTSNTLRKVTLPVVSNEECSRVFGDRITPDNICGFQCGSGLCKGDSGGTLDHPIWSRNSRFYAIGIGQFTDTECMQHTVFARVTHFLQWIQDTTKETFCKI